MKKMIELDAVYRFNQAIAHTSYVDEHVVLWRRFDPRKKRFPTRGHQSTPRWYFEKHMRPIKTRETVDGVMSAAAEIGVHARIK